ncbi:hypothetical protein GH5_04795 [Leishmania sp. Ghana 2012 LV757]|uniref:hypothetical protein n=1 Tax=Leishmania sp. Ghana 2012 LV757 TaxID=2803181 RepID=UPI001B450E5C|nr:hypothetical protein GH5_04795 [Leishmania sp. Ghana 2012 LV757]
MEAGIATKPANSPSSYQHTAEVKRHQRDADTSAQPIGPAPEPHQQAVACEYAGAAPTEAKRAAING